MSTCTLCDSDQHPCPEHPKAHRYLAPIVYEPVAGGWRAPDDERERWEAPTITNKAVLQPGAARPLDELVAQLEHWLFISHHTQQQLEAAYKQNPRKTSRLAEAAADGAQNQTMQNPIGYLLKYAKEITGDG